MKIKICIAAGLAALILCLPSVSVAREQAPGDIEPGFSSAQLAQILAPIALYPDPLLAQILMASTYPIEVVEADRWVKQNPTLTGPALDDALKEKQWDVSVKSLAHFPRILARMNDQIGETSMLGNAFLDQQTDVMDTIQQLRVSARAAGNLETTKEQTVIADQEGIRIEPANPRVIYVPAYYPYRVYGTWWYPDYPPFEAWYPIWYPPTGFVTFSTGLWVGAAIGWCDFSWHRRTVNVYYHHTQRFYKKDYFRRQNYRPGPYVWRHDPVHRRGVVYGEGRIRTFNRPAAMPRQAMHPIYAPGPKGPARAVTGPKALPLKQQRHDLQPKMENGKQLEFRRQQKVNHKQQPGAPINNPVPSNPPAYGQGNHRARDLSIPEDKTAPAPQNSPAYDANRINRQVPASRKKPLLFEDDGDGFGTRTWQNNGFSRGNRKQTRQ